MFKQFRVMPSLCAVLALLAQGLALCIADTDFVVTQFQPVNRIIRFDGASGAPLGVFAQHSTLAGPIGMSLGPDANLYVANATTSTVARFDGRTGEALGVFASAGLVNPFDVTFGPGGDLYVSSLGNNRIMRFDGQTGASLGTFASGGGLDWPEGLRFGRDGHLYVASKRSHEVLRYDGQTGAFLGVAAAGAGLRDPFGLLFDGEGNLFIASSSSHSVYRLRENGEFGVFIPSRTGGMAWPRFMALGPENGLLYVTADHSVLRFDPTNGSFVDEFAVTGPEAGPMDIVFIPEPATAALLAVCVCVLWRRSRA